MFNSLKIALRCSSKLYSNNSSVNSIRTFLSQAYYCNEVWEHRLRSPIISKINTDELYQELDQKFGKTGQISAVDVDLFANSVTKETYIDEVTDLVHKLRLSASASNILDSTPHALIRLLIEHKKYEDLLNILSDRLNYGVFLDYYTASMLMDIFYKNGNFMAGSFVMSQLMLQEEFDHPLCINLGLLHCYKYLLQPVDWPKDPEPEEPEEEVKIRVKYLRNPYYDDHFDLFEPKQLIGKTLWMSTLGKDNILDISLHVVGLELHGKTEDANKILMQLKSNGKKLYSEILQLLPEDNEIRKVGSTNAESSNIENLLIDRVKKAERDIAEKDIALQCEKFSIWEEQRKSELEKQHERLLIQQRLANVENIQKELKEREMKLWFFENKEKINLGIEAKKVFYPKKWFGKKKKPKIIDEGYIPPEIK